MFVGEYCQYLAVQDYVLLLETVDELTVGHRLIAVSEASINADVPDAAIRTLLLLAATECVGSCVEEGFFCEAFLILSAPPKTLGLF